MKVPDIGHFAGTPVIEILVVDGDIEAAEDPLLTLDPTRAMDVPAPFAGIVGQLQVKVGDEISDCDAEDDWGDDDAEQSEPTEVEEAEKEAEPESAAAKSAPPGSFSARTRRRQVPR